MLVTFGKNVVEIQYWETKSELICCLSQCDLGSILLGENADTVRARKIGTEVIFGACSFSMVGNTLFWSWYLC